LTPCCLADVLGLFLILWGVMIRAGSAVTRDIALSAVASTVGLVGLVILSLSLSLIAVVELIRWRWREQRRNFTARR